MKSFIEYLKESAEEKKYVFKIKVAGELPEHCDDCMEAALQQFKVSRFTKGKSTPIQANLIDFPSIKNSAMTVFETELDYPATSAVVTEILANATGISRDCICVRTPLEEAALEAEQIPEKKDNKPLLTQDYAKENNQSMVGDKHVSAFLKQLSKLSKENQPTQYKGVNEKLLAKSVPKEKMEEMPKTGPAKSTLQGLSGNPDPRKGK